MNTAPALQATARLASFAAAALLTLAMLAGVNGLATPDAGAPQWAEQSAAAGRA